MSLLYDDTQKQIAHEAGRLLDARFSGETLKGLLEERGQFDEQFWSLCGHQGWTAIALPEAHGGLGLGIVELGIIAQAGGAAACGAPFLNSSFGAGQAILRYANDTLRQQYLPGLASGHTKGAIAFAEAQGPVPAQPQLELIDGHLSGTKPAVPGGGRADIAIVLAAGKDGPVLALVALDSAMVERRLLDTFDNSRVAADLIFSHAEATTLAGADDALQAARRILQLQSIVTAHEQVGGAERVMMQTRDYVMNRKAFGQPIAMFQSLKHRIAELYVLIEIARANALHAAANADSPGMARYAAAARLSAIEAYGTAALDAVQMHGGIGVTWEADFHLHQRRSRTLALEQGNRMFWEDELVADLEKGHFG